MGLLTVQNPPEGTEPTWENADASGDTFPNDGMTALWVDTRSGSSGSVDVKVNAQVKNRQGQLVDRTVNIPYDNVAILPPGPKLDPYYYNDAQGIVSITYTLNGGMVIGEVKVKPVRVFEVL